MEQTRATLSEGLPEGLLAEGLLELGVAPLALGNQSI